MMEQSIKNFPKQFLFNPEIQNAEKLALARRFVVLGMGGSSLAAEILKMARPGADIIFHRDYDLPEVDFKDTLVIASSYSGNTEETISGFERARRGNLPIAVISVGGKLIELARGNNIPFIQLPSDGIQPRMGLGYQIRALFKLMGLDDELLETGRLAGSLDVAAAALAGERLAEKLSGKVPIIYASGRNGALARNWKITFNETGKIPSFYNILPELNHNEMTGFDATEASRPLSEKFHFIFLRDSADDERVQRRMKILEKLYQDRGFGVELIDLEGENIWEKTFGSLLIGVWSAYYLALSYGAEPEQVPMVEEFKARIKN